MPSALATAIAKAEGFGISGAIPTVSNNPGDLALGDQGYGTAPGSSITVFPDADSGWAALENQLQLIASGASRNFQPGWSLAQIGNVWAGGDPNWAINVANALYVAPNTSFADAYQGGSPVSLASPAAIVTTAATAVETEIDTVADTSLLESLGTTGIALVSLGGLLLLYWLVE